MQVFYDVNAPKKATNLSLNSDLLKKKQEHLTLIYLQR